MAKCFLLKWDDIVSLGVRSKLDGTEFITNWLFRDPQVWLEVVIRGHCVITYREVHQNNTINYPINLDRTGFPAQLLMAAQFLSFIAALHHLHQLLLKTSFYHKFWQKSLQSTIIQFRIGNDEFQYIPLNLHAACIVLCVLAPGRDRDGGPHTSRPLEGIIESWSTFTAPDSPCNHFAFHAGLKVVFDRECHVI